MNPSKAQDKPIVTKIDDNKFSVATVSSQEYDVTQIQIDITSRENDIAVAQAEIDNLNMLLDSAGAVGIVVAQTAPAEQLLQATP